MIDNGPFQLQKTLTYSLLSSTCLKINLLLKFLVKNVRIRTKQCPDNTDQSSWNYVNEMIIVKTNPPTEGKQRITVN